MTHHDEDLARLAAHIESSPVRPRSFTASASMLAFSPSSRCMATGSTPTS